MTTGPKSKSTPTLRASIVLPFRLPTRNQINALPFRDRLKVKKFIRDTVSQCIADAGGSRTPTASTLKAQSTAWSVVDYLKTITRSGATRLSTSKKNHSTRRR